MKTRPGRPRGLTRLARALGLDRNPLRRPTDRAEAWIRVGLLGIFLIAGPMAALGAGHWAYHAGITTETGRPARPLVDRHWQVQRSKPVPDHSSRHPGRGSSRYLLTRPASLRQFTTVRSAGNNARYRAVTDGYTWPRPAQGRGGYSAGL